MFSFQSWEFYKLMFPYKWKKGKQEERKKKERERDRSQEVKEERKEKEEIVDCLVSFQSLPIPDNKPAQLGQINPGF